MGKFSLEQKIKDRLEGHEVHIDKSELWKSLGIENEEKDRKAIWFWWLGGFIGVALIAGFWWYIEKGNDVVPNEQNSSLIAIDESISKTGNETIKEESKSKHLAEIIDNVNTDYKQIKSKNEGSKITKKSSKTANSISSHLNTTANLNINTSTSKFHEEVNSKSSQSSLIDNKANSNNEIADDKKATDTPLNLVSIESIANINMFLNYESAFEKMNKRVISIIEPVASPRRFEFELFAGGGSISKELLTGDRELDGYLTIRDTSERSLEQVSVGFSLKYKLGRGFYSKVGMTLNRWNEKLNYSLYSDTIKSIQEVPEIILVDLQGNETITYGEGEANTYNRIYWTRYNRLTQIDIPISLGYEHTFHRWSIFGEATALFNLSQKFSGYLYSKELIVEKNPLIYKPRLGMNMAINIGVGYGFTERIRGRFSARYYRSLNSVLLPETGIEQKFSSIGLRASVGYLF